MKDITSQFVSASRLMAEYVDERPKFVERFEVLYDDMTAFVAAAGYEGKAIVNATVLGYALVDYFEDIERLKAFHRIEHVNSIKIIAYTSYWLLRRRPLQIVEEDPAVVYVNEQFVLAFILDALSDSDLGDILEHDTDELHAFEESLLYYLKYRVANATGIEMMLIAFFAGRSYQDDTADLGNASAKYR